VAVASAGACASLHHQCTSLQTDNHASTPPLISRHQRVFILHTGVRELPYDVQFSRVQLVLMSTYSSNTFPLVKVRSTAMSLSFCLSRCLSARIHPDHVPKFQQIFAESPHVFRGYASILNWRHFLFFIFCYSPIR